MDNENNAPMLPIVKAAPLCSRCQIEPGLLSFPGIYAHYCFDCAALIRKELMDAGDDRYTWPYLLAEHLERKKD